MLTQSEKRALLRAASQFTPNPAVDRSALEHALDACEQGDLGQCLRFLVNKKILTSKQARKLLDRFGSKRAQTKKSAASDDDALEFADTPTFTAWQENQSRSSGDTDVKGLFFGEYRVLRKLGQGGTCSVYLGYRQSDHQKAAIKVLPEKLSDHPESRDRFYREAKSGSLLNHPNIVRINSFGQDRETKRDYLIMEYVDGPTAHDLVERDGWMVIGDAVHVALDVCRALEFAHTQNVIHRDVKPSNILLTSAGIAKLADMGLAKRTDEASHLTGTHQGFGTPHYMPYEQAVNARHADGRSDIFALGATLYHLITGEVPISGESNLDIVEKKRIGEYPPASSINPNVPMSLETILQKMMAADPIDRYQTVSEVIVALERTQLAPAVPSFIDKRLAYKDPLVRERLISTAQPTRPDLRVPHGRNEPKGESDVWFVRYKTDDDKLCRAKMTLTQLAKRILAGKIPRDVEVANSRHGVYQSAANIDELRQALSTQRSHRPKQKSPQPRAGRPNGDEESPKAQFGMSWSIGLGLGTVAVIILLIVLRLLFL